MKTDTKKPIPLIVYVNENPELSPPRGKLYLAASNGVLIVPEKEVSYEAISG